MDHARIATGLQPPTDINVVIGMPRGSGVRYGIERQSGTIVVDHFVPTPTACPAAYGVIPGTLTDEGELADALVLVPAVVVPGAVMRARPIGIMTVQDGHRREPWIVCVPHARIHPRCADVMDMS